MSLAFQIIIYNKSHSNGYLLIEADPRVRPKLRCTPGCASTSV